MFHIPREVGAELKALTLPHLRLRIDLQIVRNTVTKATTKATTKDGCQLRIGTVRSSNEGVGGAL